MRRPVRPEIPQLLAALALCASVATAASRPVSFGAADSLLDKSDLVVAVESERYRFAEARNQRWLVLKITTAKAFKGKFFHPHLWIKCPEELWSGPGVVQPFPGGKASRLYFLKEAGNGKYDFAVDPLGQGEIVLPSGIDLWSCSDFSDLVVAAAPKATGFSQQKILPLLAGLASEMASACLAELSESSDAGTATLAVLTRIKARDRNAIPAAKKLLARADLAEATRHEVHGVLAAFAALPNAD